MDGERTIAERLAEIAAALRSPLARDLIGETTAVGRPRMAELNALLEEVSSVPAVTAYDALALVSVSLEMVYLVAANSEGNTTSLQASRMLGDALRSLTKCLEKMSGRPERDFHIRTDVALFRSVMLQ